jgi:predicted naringenin-chalcone synthase
MTALKTAIGSVAVETPPHAMNQQQVEASIKKYYSSRLNPRSMEVLEKVFRHPSIGQRRFAFDASEELVDEHPDHRIARFTHWAVELSERAINKALNQAKVDPKNVSGLVVNTCTGYICPGLSTYLIEKVGLPRDILALDLVGGGCGGAIPNLQTCQALLQNKPDSTIVSVSTEICSSTFQVGDDLSLIVSNALFADGAAASVLWNRPVGLSLIASTNRHAPEDREHIRYVHKNGQLHNQLSLKLPFLASKTVTGVISDLLTPHGLKPADIKFWAMHPGGENVINAVQEKVGLSEDQLRPTRQILAQYGNMSSPTVWFVLDELLKQGIAPGEFCVMVAFGAGLSAHALLLQAQA